MENAPVDFEMADEPGSGRCVKLIPASVNRKCINQVPHALTYHASIQAGNDRSPVAGYLSQHRGGLSAKCGSSPELFAAILISLPASETPALQLRFRFTWRCRHATQHEFSMRRPLRGIVEGHNVRCLPASCCSLETFSQLISRAPVAEHRSWSAVAWGQHAPPVATTTPLSQRPCHKGVTSGLQNVNLLAQGLFKD